MNAATQNMHQQESMWDITRMAFPLGLAILAIIGNTLIDVIMVGGLGVRAVAAVTLGMQLYIVAVVATEGFVKSFPPLYTRAMGEGRQGDLPAIMQAAIVLVLPLSLIVCFLLWHGDYVLHWTGQDPKLTAESEAYGNIIALAIIPATLQSLFWETNSIYGRSRHVAIAAAIGFAINIAANQVFIFGFGPIPAMGIAGAAWSTVLTTSIGAVVLLWPIRQTVWQAVLAKSNRLATLTGNMVRLGIPIAIAEGVTMGFFTATTFVVGWYGEIALAAHIVAFQISEIAITFALGLGEVASIKTGFASASANRNRVRRLVVRLLTVAALVSALMMVLLIGGAGFYPRIYIPDTDPNADAAIALAITLIYISSAFTLVDNMQFVLTGSLRGLQDTRWPMMLIFIGYWLIGMPAILLMAEGMGLGAVGVWLGMLVGLVAVALPLGWRLRRQINRL